jgi:hypothetical protein
VASIAKAIAVKDLVRSYPEAAAVWEEEEEEEGEE